MFSLLAGRFSLNCQGWEGELKKGALPPEFVSFVEFIEKEAGVWIDVLSTGADREELIVRRV
jgi:adenylosuccinate synthase